MAPAERSCWHICRAARRWGLPLLTDDTCWLLAINLDGGTWRQNVGAVRDACGQLGVVPAVERSRSGTGAHVWFFFDEPVPGAAGPPVRAARLDGRDGTLPDLGMASYDRLSRARDTLPKGGFGNLIAQPLQHGPRRQGNTVFLDEKLDGAGHGPLRRRGNRRPRLDALLLAMPVAWKGTVVQYAGRGGSSTTTWNAELPVLRRMFAKRPKAYRTLGHELAQPV